jgi:hypothetical protein
MDGCSRKMTFFSYHKPTRIRKLPLKFEHYVSRYFDLTILRKSLNLKFNFHFLQISSLKKRFFSFNHCCIKRGTLLTDSIVNVLRRRRMFCQGSMLWSQFAAIFDNFQRKNWRFLKNQCYDQNFRRFSAKKMAFSQKKMLWSQFSAIFDNFRRKIGVFLKNQCYDHNFA